MPSSHFRELQANKISPLYEGVIKRQKAPPYEILCAEAEDLGCPKGDIV